MNENFGLLFATPNFLEGVARTLDLSGTFTQYNTFADPREADFLALRSDWRAIDEDFDTVLAEYENTNMAPTLTPETETRRRTEAEASSSDTEPHEAPPLQGSAEWEKRLWSLGQHSHGVPLSSEATSREVIYEDAAL